MTTGTGMDYSRYVLDSPVRLHDPMGTWHVDSVLMRHKIRGCKSKPAALAEWSLEPHLEPGEEITEQGWVIIQFLETPNWKECIAGTTHTTPSKYYKAFRLENPSNGLIVPGLLTNAPGHCAGGIGSNVNIFGASIEAAPRKSGDNVQGTTRLDIAIRFYPDSIAIQDHPGTWKGDNDCYPLLSGRDPSFWGTGGSQTTQFLDLDFDCCPACPAPSRYVSSDAGADNHLHAIPAFCGRLSWPYENCERWRDTLAPLDSQLKTRRCGSSDD